MATEQAHDKAEAKFGVYPKFHRQGECDLETAGVAEGRTRRCCADRKRNANEKETLMYQVIDPDNNLLDINDDEPVPDGCRLAISAMFMDSIQKSVFEANMTTDKDDTDISIEAAQALRDKAYAEFRRSIDTANVNRRIPLPPTPSWQQSPYKPPKNKKLEQGGAPNGDSATDDADYYDAWKYKKHKPANAGPWSRSQVKPQWTRPTGTIPSVGGTSVQDMRRTFADKATQAYADRNAWLSNAWKENRG
jgi:hypothetical protein